MVIKTSPFQEGVIDLIANLLEFFNKINPNPFVAITALEVAKYNFMTETI